MNTKSEKSKLNPSVNRRTFLKVSGVLASAAMAGPVFTKSKAAADPTDQRLSPVKTCRMLSKKRRTSFTVPARCVTRAAACGPR